MKQAYCILIFLCLLNLPNFAQSAYKGGSGDGYASAQIVVNLTAINPKDDIFFQVYPNPIKRTETLKIKMKGSENDFVLLNIYNALGAKVLEEKGSLFQIISDKNLLNFTGFSAGIYLLQLQIQGRTFSHHLQITN